MNKRQPARPLGHIGSGPVNADPAHAPGKQHRDLMPGFSGRRGDPKQQINQSFVKEQVGRTHESRRGR